MRKIREVFLMFFCSLFIIGIAQNPIIHNQFTADPTARIFNGKVYLFPSHDIKTPEGKNLRKDWFCMADYHVFSSENLTDWTDHGVIVSQNKVKWVDSTSYSMWAPDCVERNGKYYFYFPANTNQMSANGRKGFGIGVAIAQKPEGPYIPLNEPISNVRGIDPCVLIDKSGQAYLYWSQGNIYGAKIKENMTELNSEAVIIKDLPEKGLKEGPFVFERNGIYYMTYPHVENSIERLEYAVSNQPLGPFKYAGVIMDESPNACWTNHHSIVNFKNQWYLFYHQNDWSPEFDKNRSVRIDSLSFNPDGTIRKVIPTLRGVGLTKANDEIQLDRYTKLSKTGASIAFLDTANTFAGWKIILTTNAWVQYNTVQFSTSSTRKLVAKVQSISGGTLEIRLDQVDSPIIASVRIPKGLDWQNIESIVKPIKSGNHNLVVSYKGSGNVELDWIKFK